MSDKLQTVINLHNLIKKYRKSYYEEGKCLISDYEFDILHRRFVELSYEFPEFKDSVGYINRTVSTIPHFRPMLSLDSLYDKDKLLTRFNKILTQNNINIKDVEISCEPKIDGLAVELIYNNNFISSISVRGDENYGENITKTLLSCPNIPKILQSDVDVSCQVCGELYITYADFHSLCLAIDKLSKANINIKQYKNIRNAASGIARNKKDTYVLARFISFFPYSIHKFNESFEICDIYTQNEMFQTLKSLGFEFDDELILLTKHQEDIFDYIEHMESIRSKLPLQIDGLVFKINDPKIRDLFGNARTYPRWAIAYKFQGHEVESVIEDVKFQIGQTGTLTPIASIKPVNINGSNITKVSLANYSKIKEKDLKIGDRVIVTLAKDIIPLIVKVVGNGSLRDGSEQEIIFPDTCPICNSQLSLSDKNIYTCQNYYCNMRVSKRIRQFILSINLIGFGNKTIEFCCNNGLIKYPYDLINLVITQSDILKKLIGEKTLTKLFYRLKRIIDQPLHLSKFIESLAISSIDTASSQILSSYFKENDLYSFDDFWNKLSSLIKNKECTELNIKQYKQLELFIEDSINKDIVNKTKMHFKLYINSEQ